MTLDKLGIAINANFDIATTEVIRHMVRAGEFVTLTFTNTTNVRDLTPNKPYRVYCDVDRDVVISDDSNDRMVLTKYLSYKTPGNYNVTIKDIQEWKETIRVQKKQLLERFSNAYFTKHDLKPGDRVKWREGMILGNFMDDGVDAVVAEVLDEPIRLPINDVSDLSNNVFNEFFDIRVMLIGNGPHGIMGSFALLPSYRIERVEDEE